jgi:hypothetical protein
MHISDLKKSRYLTKEEAGDGLRLTIDEVRKENVAPSGEKPDQRYVLSFSDHDKPMVLNSTNGQLISRITGSENSDDWQGHEIELYRDDNVSFGGKVVGGIRVRAVKAATKKGKEPAMADCPY